MSPALRCALAVHATRVSRNAVLEVHAASFGVRLVGVERFAELLQCDDAAADSLARRLAVAARRVPHGLTPELVSQLAAAFSPRALVELVLTASVCSALQRLTVTARRKPWRLRFPLSLGITDTCCV